MNSQVARSGVRQTYSLSRQPGVLTEIGRTFFQKRAFALGALFAEVVQQGRVPRQFLEASLKTPLPKRLHFTSPDKIIELIERGGGFPDQESRLMLEQGIAMGRGYS